MFDFYRVAAICPKVMVADASYNVDEILKKLEDAYQENVAVIAFPELAVTGYSCQDLFFQQALIRAAGEGLSRILSATSGHESAVIVGAPALVLGQLYNAAYVMLDGKLMGVTVKTFLPNYHEFYEKRWFNSADALPVKDIYLSELGITYDDEDTPDYSVPIGSHLIYDLDGKLKFGVEICEDLWAPIPPSSVMALAGAELIVNISASNELIAKRAYRRNLVTQTSASLVCDYLYVSAGAGESTQDVVFSGHGMIAENGTLLTESSGCIEEEGVLYADLDLELLRSERMKMKSFGDAADHYRGLTARSRVVTEASPQLPESDGTLRPLRKHPFIPGTKSKLKERCSDIFEMQVGGLVKRLQVTNGKPVVGVSGGMDSTLALLVSAQALQKMNRPASDLIAITMPAFGTSNRTYENSLELIRSLGTEPVIIDIKAACIQHLSDLGHDGETKDITYENTQARERTQILMDYANMHGGLVVGTGDLSELALGWCTYNGDQMAMYGVNGSIPKTLVRWMIDTVTETEIFPKSTEVLRDILDTPISPELLPPDENGQITQKTEDSVGPYELHDFFLYYTLRYGYAPDKINFLANRAFKDIYTPDVIMKWQTMFTKRFFSQQFKRSCMPDGVKVGSVAMSPRGDWRMPSDASVKEWLAMLEKESK